MPFNSKLETRNSELETLIARLRTMGSPFLNWAGKAERLSFDVPTLPLFVHERLSTKAILSTCSTSSSGPRSGPWPTRYCGPTSTATAG